MSGYVRQSLADIVPGVVVQAGPLNKEFNALAATFSGSAGHTHDGTVGSGPRLSLTHSVTGILPVGNGGTGAADLSDIQTNLGLVIGVNVQAYSEPLQKLSIKTGVGIVVRSTGSAWEFREIKGAAKQIKVGDGTGVASDIVIGFADELDLGTRKVSGGEFTSIKATGTFIGNGAGLTAVPSSGIVGLNTELDKKFDKAGGIITGPTVFGDNVSVANGKKISQPQAPTLAADLVNKAHLDSETTNAKKRENHTGFQPMDSISGLLNEFKKYVAKAGDAMTGLLNMGGQRITNLAAGTQNTDAVRMDQLLNAMPTGATIPFAGPSAPPGWLLCAGQAVSRTTYSTLFSQIGTRFGTGNGTSTFNVPNFTGRTPIGVDTNNSVAGQVVNLGTSGGTSGAKLTSNMLPSHTHAVDIVSQNGGEHTHPYTISKARDWDSPAGDWIGQGGDALNRTGTERIHKAGIHNHRVTGNTQATGRADPYSTMQPFLGMNFIIKT